MDCYTHNNRAAYCEAQEATALAKRDKVWAEADEIEALSVYIKQRCKPQFGLCHGVRTGWEVHRFIQHLGCEVVGTELSVLGDGAPNVIRWDFHEVKPEWVGACDFVYNNSLDHARDPEAALRTWLSCLRQPHGVCIVQWTTNHACLPATPSECFVASADEYTQLFERCGEIVDVIRMPACWINKKGRDARWFVVKPCES